jgi:hypothetical protein|nr:MAG TPA: hypothetical protein [Caudoviricetes sp.]
MAHNLYIETQSEYTGCSPQLEVLNVRDCKHIIASLDHYPPTADEVKKAICILTGRLIYRSVWIMESDIDSLNMSLSPPKEMTIEEIEKELGHKVKIVEEKEK